MVPENTSGPIDCACVIHGTGYSWQYVDRLYNMLTRNLSRPVRLHVYTEANRPVPAPYIKHSLKDLGITGPRRSWWYKIQLFDTTQFCGPLLYFDLDVVIVDNIDWIWKLPLNYFWSVRDFKYLWDSKSCGLNSSIMWWNTATFGHVWQNFNNTGVDQMLIKYRGDQDYITEAVTPEIYRFFETDRVKSWKWQCLDGGYNFEKRQHFKPNTGTLVTTPTSVLVFHGKPNPDQVQDPVVVQHWQ